MHSFTLYHHPLSVCSMKVRLALEEKGLAWSSRVIDIVKQQEQLQPWYLALNPKGVIPTLQYSDGASQVVNDSAEIIRFIGRLPEGAPLLPQDAEQARLMQSMIDLADSIDLQILSYARHPSPEKSGEILDLRIAMSKQLAQQHPELQAHYETCAKRSEANKTLRVSAEHVSEIERGALAALARVEAQLEGADFIVGNAYSLADVIWTVVLSRLELLGYNDWLDAGRFPLVGDYYSRVKQRASFKLAQIQNAWWENK